VNAFPRPIPPVVQSYLCSPDLTVLVRVCYKAFLAAGRAIAVAVVVVFKGQGSEHVLKAPQIACSTQ